jgi:hypothetical protein
LKLCIVKPRALKLRVAEGSAMSLRFFEICALEICFVEIGALEIGVDKGCPLKLRKLELRRFKTAKSSRAPVMRAKFSDASLKITAVKSAFSAHTLSMKARLRIE